jgi:hypothetical protein
MRDKLKKIKSDITKLITVLDREGCLGPIGYLESCLDEIDMAESELDFFYADEEE